VYKRQLLACSFLLLASYTTFRIGQVRWLLIGVGVLIIISFLIISTATFIVNKFIPASLSLFNKQFIYTFFVVALSYFVYLLYSRNILNVKNLVFRFYTNQPIYQYIAKISESTSLQTLIESVEKEVPKLFKIEFIIVWFPPDFWHKTPLEHLPTSTASIQLPPENILMESIKYLITTDLPWSAEKPLVGLKLPSDLEDQLTQYPISLLFPIPVTGYTTGLLIVGNKNRGVFLLSEVALLGQIVRQLRLTISILKLLEKEKELARLALESQLSALRAQINPHFLFNALNSISALVYYDPELAERAVMKLSEVFRYTLESSKENLAFFEKEINMVKNYLEIEKIRFGDRLNFSIQVQDADCNAWLVPTLLLQTIVENCIKHGISKIIHAGVVNIDAYIELETDRLIVIIYDNGPGIDLNRIKASTGLKNTLERLERLYNRNDLIIFENTGQGTRVTLRLPYIEDLSQTNDN
jgi:sensor histidine kinase YesM